MRSEQFMLQLILDFAGRDDNIRVVLLNGSRANPNAPRDPLQDFDVVCLARDIGPYVRNRAIPPTFGEPMILQLPDDMAEPPPEPDGHYTYLMQFQDGNRIDLSFQPLAHLEEAARDSLTRVLLDKDGLVADLPAPSDRDYLPRPPTAKAFHDCCNEFWWVNPYVAKGLWRGELTYAKFMLDTVLRPELLRMLTWHFGARTGFQRAAGKAGKYLQAGLAPETWAELRATYADADFDRTWESLFAMGRLFRRIAQDLSTRFAFNYPLADDERVSAYLRRIRDMPRDA